MTFALWLAKSACLLKRKTGIWIYFSVLLKCYEQNQCFIETLSDVSSKGRSAIAKQIGCTQRNANEEIAPRTIELYREQIRGYFDSIGVSRSNEENIKLWLVNDILPTGDFSTLQLLEKTTSFIKNNQAELPCHDYLTRIILSAKQEYEDGLFKAIADSLNNETKG